MNDHYINTNGTRIEYEFNPNSEKKLFADSISDRLFFENEERIVGIEIGVLNGETSGFFLNTFPNLFLYGIDPIIPDSMESSLIGSIEIISSNVERNKDRWDFINDYSFNVVDRFNDFSIDFIFIDGDHTYEAVAQDYTLYIPKLKHGGLLFMHDSRMNRGGANFHIGSSRFADYIIANDQSVSLIGEAFSLTSFIKK